MQCPGRPSTPSVLCRLRGLDAVLLDDRICTALEAVQLVYDETRSAAAVREAPLAVEVWDLTRMSFVDVTAVLALGELKEDIRGHCGPQAQFHIVGMAPAARRVATRRPRSLAPGHRRAEHRCGLLKRGARSAGSAGQCVRGCGYREVRHVVGGSCWHGTSMDESCFAICIRSVAGDPQRSLIPRVGHDLAEGVFVFSIP